jgi:ABC-type transporter Mla subunit MlaD
LYYETNLWFSTSVHDILIKIAQETMYMSADVIPFPLRPALADAGQERLQRALAGLDAALASQRMAVAEWRKSLAQLGETMNGLGSSLNRYRGSLDQLETKVGALNREAVALEAWADQVLSSAEG